MSIFIKSLAIISLISLVLSVEIKLSSHQVEDKKASKSHKFNHQNANIEATRDIEDFKGDKVFDTQYYATATLGSTLGDRTQEVNLIIDTTSFHTSVQYIPLTKPTTALASGLNPIDPVFQCDQGTCKELTLQPDEKGNSLVFSTYPFGGKLKETFLIASQKEFSLGGLQQPDNFQIGLGFKWDQQTIDVSTTKTNQLLQKDSGVLGLGFGSAVQDYKNGRELQVNPLQRETNLDPLNNYIHQLSHNNKKTIPSSVFSLFLEKDLNLLIVGEPQNYFANGQSQTFQNYGKNSWALKVTNLQLSNKIIMKNIDPNVNYWQLSADDKKKVTTDTLAVLDSTTEYIWMSETRTQDLKDQIKSQYGRTCTGGEQATGDPISCDCENINEFGSLSLSFNNKQKVQEQVNIAPEFFAKYVNNKCQLNIRGLSAKWTDGNEPEGQPKDAAVKFTQDVILVGQALFKSNYLVFDQESNSVTISPARTVSPSPLKIDHDHRVGFIIVGVVLFFIGLFSIIGVLAQIDPSKIVVQTKPVEPSPKPVQVVTIAQPQPQYFIPGQSRIQPQIINSQVGFQNVQSVLRR